MKKFPSVDNLVTEIPPISGKQVDTLPKRKQEDTHPKRREEYDPLYHPHPRPRPHYYGR